MKSKKQVLADNADYKTLINGVLKNMELSEVETVNNHGINVGIGNFIYYRDTCAFYKRYRSLINKMVFEMAESLGESAVEMVGAFNCIGSYDYKTKSWKSENNWQNEIGVCLYGGKLSEETTQVENALAWFAAEEVCRMFEN